MLHLFTLSTLLGVAYSQYELNNKAVGVQLFQWNFNDIARECTEFLGPNGYSYVQTSPVQIHVKNAFDGYQNPWYLMYQPLGYKIGNRLGTEDDFRTMVSTCRRAGVDVVVDVVLNHMSYVDIADNGGYGTNTSFNARNGRRDYPDVPYNSTHFHDSICNGIIKDADWKQDFPVWNCRLANLADLKTGDAYVRKNIVDFLNKLTDIGVVGFRVDASKVVPLADWQAIFSQLKNNYRGVKPYIGQEIFFAFESDNSYKNYQSLGRVFNFDYAQQVGQAFRNREGRTTDQLAGILSRLQLNGAVSTSFIENHDKERDPSGDFSFALARINDGWWYKQAQAFNILYPYGIPIVHSGFRFQYFGGERIRRESPVSAPSDANGMIQSVGNIVNNVCSGIWMCQHRWSDVFPLVRVRNWIGEGLRVEPRINTNGPGSNQIHFNVPGRGFVAINSAQNGQWNENQLQSIYTGLPQGRYCNMVYGSAANGKCNLWPGVVLLNREQVEYFVDARGMTTVKIGAADKSRVVALYTGPEGIVQ
jgi:alpha-amylase